MLILLIATLSLCSKLCAADGASSVDSSFLAVQNLKATCGQRVAACQTELINLMDISQKRSLPPPAMQEACHALEKLSPQENTLETMIRFATGHIEQYKNIMEVCDTYIACRDVKKLGVLYYLIMHFRGIFLGRNDRNHHLWQDAWKAHGIYEEENIEEIKNAFNESLEKESKSVAMSSGFIRNKLIESCVGAYDGVGTRRLCLNTEEYVYSIDDKIYFIYKYSSDIYAGDFLLKYRQDLSMLEIEFLTAVPRFEQVRILSANPLHYSDSFEFLRLRTVLATAILFYRDIEQKVDLLVKEIQEIKDTQKEKKRRDAILQSLHKPKYVSGKKRGSSSESSAERSDVFPIEKPTEEDDKLIAELSQHVVLSEADCTRKTKETNQRVDRILGITTSSTQADSLQPCMEPTTLLPPPTLVSSEAASAGPASHEEAPKLKNAMEYYAFERTKLYEVMQSIRRGESVKQREFMAAIKRFLGDRSRESHSVMLHQGGSKVKCTTDHPQNATDKLDLHLHHDDVQITTADPRYKKTLDWLQKLGFFRDDEQATLGLA